MLTKGEKQTSRNLVHCLAPIIQPQRAHISHCSYSQHCLTISSGWTPADCKAPLSNTSRRAKWQLFTGRVDVMHRSPSLHYSQIDISRSATLCLWQLRYIMQGDIPWAGKVISPTDIIKWIYRNHLSLQFISYMDPRGLNSFSAAGHNTKP